MKRITTVLIPVSIALLYSCGSKKDNADTTAQSLIDEAKTEIHTSPQRAIELLDSVDKNYKTDVEIIKQSIQLRPQAIEQLTLIRISETDSLLETKKRDIETLRASMQWVKEPRMVDGYYIAKGAYNPNFMNTTGIEARVTDIGRFYIVSSANPGNRHTSVTLTDGATSATTGDVPYDGESNYRISGGEVITFSPEQSDTVGKYVTLKNTPLTLQFNGKSKLTRKLSARDVESISTAYRYATAVETARNTDIELQKLKKQLEIARAQQQRLTEKAMKE